MFAPAFTPAGVKRLLQFGHDSTISALSLPLALVLLVGIDGLEPYSRTLVLGVPLFTVVAALWFIQFKLYRGMWRFTSVADLQTIISTAGCAVLSFALLAHLGAGLELPPSALFIQFLCLSSLLAGSRCLRRLLSDHRTLTRARTILAKGNDHVPLLLVGGLHNADLVIRACRKRSENVRYRILGLVDLADHHVGRQIMNVPILGTVARLPEILSDLERKGKRPQRIVLISSLQGQPLRDLQEIAEQAKVTLCRLPKPTEFRDARNDGLDLRPIAVEDLLTRPQVKLERQAIDGLIDAQRVLVTGAGGSIGSELCRQIARCNPALLTLLDNCEYNLYAIDMDLQERFPGVPRELALVDIRDGAAVERIFRDRRPDLVFNAAALKHVPLVEHNPLQGVQTNVFGTRNVAEAARRHGVLAFVQVSTDKAVSPTNVMGATKRLAEYYCQALDLAGGRADGTNTYFKTVRFGNVMGSSGSVIPLFQRQLREGGPITVTHPDITRYFMTIREAAELVLQALAGGLRHAVPRGEIFVLDMGSPVRILDVAQQMIRLSGLTDVKIDFVGLRPGEKLYEELFDSREEQVASGIPGVLKAHSKPMTMPMLEAAFEDLQLACASGDETAVIRMLARYVPGYIPPAHVDTLAPALSAIGRAHDGSVVSLSERRHRQAGQSPVVRVLDA